MSGGKPWTEDEIKLLRKHYGVMPTRKLAEKIGRRYGNVIAKANSIGLRTRDWYTPEQMAIIRAEYPHTPTKVLAEKLGMKAHNLEQWARRYGIYKAPDYKADLYAKQSERLMVTGASSRFQPGLIPWNTGRKGVSHPGSVATQFKPGQKPHSYKPLGSERLRHDGYVQIKVQDAGRHWERWRAKHVVLWEAAHGPVPKNHAVVFINGDKRDFRLENLELITRVELMRRNSYHDRYPQDLKDVIHARAALTRVINNRKRGQQREEQARGSA
jgi:hypothetical protein